MMRIEREIAIIVVLVIGTGAIAFLVVGFFPPPLRILISGALIAAAIILLRVALKTR